MTEIMVDISSISAGALHSSETEGMNYAAPGYGAQRVGRVIAITPSQAIILLERRDASGSAENVILLEMGTLVKLHSRVSVVYGMITGLRVPLPSLEPSDKDLRLVELELVGEIRHADGASVCFRRGASGSPASMSPCISPRPAISRRFMRAPTYQQLGSE